MKLIDLVEQNIRYTPERIDELIKEGTVFFNKSKNYFNKSYSFVLTLTIQECIQNNQNISIRFEEMKEIKSVIESKFDKYYNIVDLYEIGEYPDNVRDLEKISDGLDDLSMNM